MRRVNHTRYDCPQGYVICENGRPYQAGFRNPTIDKARKGLDDLECWLAPLGHPIPPAILSFLIMNFKQELDREWENRRH